MKDRTNRLASCLALVLLIAGVGPATAESDLILRAPEAEALEIAERNGLVIVEQIDVAGDPAGQGLYRVRAEAGVSPETVIEALEALEPTVVGIEEVALASLPELDQSVMAVLDQSVMAVLDALMATHALSPPIGQAGPGLLGEPDDRKIKKIKIEQDDFDSKELVFYMLDDENRQRQEVTLRADFAPGCSVEYNRSEDPPVEGGLLEFNGRKLEWEIINNSSSPLTLDRIDVSWPAANGGLEKVKLGVEIKQVFAAPSVGVDFSEVETPDKRQIKAENTETLQLEFENDALVGQPEYGITVSFAEGPSVTATPCSVIAEDPPRYERGKLEWEIVNAGHSDAYLESLTIGWPEENGVISRIDFGGKAVLKTEMVFGKYFNGQKEEDRLVWVGYVDQPAAAILRAQEAQKDHKGSATVAVIDTGVDPNHWLLADALVPGYDFLRDQAGYASEVDGVLDQSVMAVLDSTSPMPLEEEAAFQLDQSVMAVLDAEQAAALAAADLPPALGHGTMVAGIIHRVAPHASIMPLRVFDAYGHADLLDIVEAIYYAVDHGANVINMSFSVETFSPELMRAVNYAARNGVSSVASAGNEGKEKIVYPAAFGNTIGVASTTASDEVSQFSNLGSDLVTIATPGEAVVTTFPGGGWAIASGTSFSAPWISGVIAIFADKNGRENQPGRADFFLASEALSHSVAVQGHGKGKAGHGRADLKEAVDRLKDSVGVGSTGLSELPYLILVDFFEGCALTYPPQTYGTGCTVEVSPQLEVDGDTVELTLTNAGEATISLASIEISWPAAHEELKEIKLDGDRIFEQELPPSAAIIDSGWKDPDKPERLQVEPGATVILRFDFEEEADS